RPKTSPRNKERRIVKKRTAESTRMPSQPGTHLVQSGEMLLRSTRTLENDAVIATTPPRRASSDISESSRRPSLVRFAPSAERTASSLWRAIIRAKRRFARLAQARRRSEEHTSELQSRFGLVCRLLLVTRGRAISEIRGPHV